MSGSTAMNRRTLLAGVATVMAASVTPAAAGDQSVSLAELMRLREQLRPIEQIFLDQQVYCLCNGEPNAIDGDFTYEEWLEGFEPECVDWINAGCPKREGGVS
jgi:hypothetical protein